MYLCLDCGSLFSDTRKYIEKHGLDCPPYEETIGCPSCGGAYVETVTCSSCDNYITGDYVETADGNVYCEDCYTIRNVEDSV